MWNDLCFALRQLHKSPGYAIAVVLTLALGIGVNTAVFSMVDGFMLRSLPYPQPDRIGALVLHEQGTSARTGIKFTDDDNSHDSTTWVAVRDSVPSVLAAAYSSEFGTGEGTNLAASASSGGAVRYVHSIRVSAHYFDVLGIPLYKGRAFTAEEDRAHGPKAAILSYALWQSAFRADSQLIGKAIYLKGEPYTVVGILPEGVVTPNPVDVWTPIAADNPEGQCGGNNCGILMRLQPGATWREAALQLDHLPLPRYVAAQKMQAWYYAHPLALDVAGEMQSRSKLLMFAVSFILLIACANLAGLALVRIARRTPEMATRLALGATRYDILRQLWMESLVLAVGGAAAALVLASVLLSGLQRFLPPAMIPLGGFSMNVRILTFTIGTSLLTSLFFGALPALQTRRVDLRSSIAAGSKAVSGGTGRARQWLIGAEVALTVVLLASAGLLVRTLIHLETLPPGFDAANVTAAKVSLDDARYHDAAAFEQLLQKSVASMRQIPGVRDAAVGLSLPYESILNDSVTLVDGKYVGKVTASSLSYITPDYFSTLRIPLLAGRAFSDGDTQTTQRVAIVNASFGRHFYDDPSPLGRHFKSGKDIYTIVGVVGNVQDQSHVGRTGPLGTEPIYYIPAAQLSSESLVLMHIWYQPSWIVRTETVRTKGSIEGLAASMQRSLAEADPNLPFSGFYSMQEILDHQLEEQRIEAALYGSLALLALALSAIGIYSLVSNLVVQRTREIGIRIALGSTLEEAMLHVGSSGLYAAGAGLVAGTALSFVALRALASQIYGVTTFDPVTFIAVSFALALIAAVASFVPTLRISRIQPADTLRAE